MSETREQLKEMVALFHQGLDIAKRLNAPEDRIAAMHAAIGGLTDPTNYVNNVKPSGGSESLPGVDYELERRVLIDRQDELWRRGLS